MPDTVHNHATCTITLQTSAAPRVSYTEMFLCDHSDIPVDVRYIDTTRTGYADDLTSSGNPYKFANVFWSQKRTADTLRLGRWISAATKAHYICADYETDYTVWKAVTTGSFKVKDNTSPTPLTDTFTGCDFSGITSISGILTVLNAKLASAVNVVGLSTATFAFDKLGRLVLTHSVTGGSASKTLTIYGGGAGTDLSLAAYMSAGVDGSLGRTIPGYDAEEPTAAITAISLINDDYYRVAIRGESTAQQQTLAAQFEALDKQLVLMCSESGAKSAVSTTDVPYLLHALSYNNTTIIYTEHTLTSTGGWGDAAVDGAVLPAVEGTTSWAFEALSGVYASGKKWDGSPQALTATEKAALDAKYCNYFETVGSDTYMYPGLNCSDEETRIILGRHWLQDAIAGDIYAYKLNNALSAFDDKTLAAFERIIRQYLTEALSRGIIIDTAARPITIDMPTADDFTAAQRASHTMELDDVFSAYINSAVNDVAITGELRI